LPDKAVSLNRVITIWLSGCRDWREASFVKLIALRTFEGFFYLRALMIKYLCPFLVLIFVYCININNSLASSASQSFDVSVTIPAIPGVNVPADEINQEVRNLSKEEFNIITEVIQDNNTRIIFKTIVAK
jgi:hypothetical protein